MESNDEGDKDWSRGSIICKRSPRDRHLAPCGMWKNMFVVAVNGVSCMGSVRRSDAEGCVDGSWGNIVLVGCEIFVEGEVL